MKVAEILPLDRADSNLWPLMRQAGVTDAVASFGRHFNGLDLAAGDGPWDYMPMLRMKNRYDAQGLDAGVLEWRPPLNLAKRGLPGRDEEIATVITMLTNMGRVGIPVWCYEWMTDFNWMRTSTTTTARAGSLVTSFDAAELRDAPPTRLGAIEDERLWDNLQYFLERVIPAAEDAGVRLAMHPDDPPLSPIRGVGRIMSSLDAYRRLLETVPSEMNGITFCQGNFRLMTDDLPSAIREFGALGKVFFVHFRDVEGTPEKFSETWHDAGPTDMLACIRAYMDVGFDGLLRSDHVPTLHGEDPNEVGYGVLGRLFAVGYIRGLIEGARGSTPTDAEAA